MQFHSAAFDRFTDGTIADWRITISGNPNSETIIFLNRTEMEQLRDLITRELAHTK